MYKLSSPKNSESIVMRYEIFSHLPYIKNLRVEV